MLVNEIMTEKLNTVSPDENLKAISAIFDQVTYRHLPVVDNENTLLGIISDRDVTKNLSPFLGTDLERDCDLALLTKTASDIMTTSPLTVAQDSSITTASILLLENQFSCLPIVNDDGKLEGLLTWKDILNFHVYSD